MTKDEELKEAREWLSARYGFPDISEDNPAIETLLAYHHHRLDTDVDGFDLSQITAKQTLDAARKSCQKNKPPKDEELTEAREWWKQWEKDNEVNSVYDPKGVDQMLLAYHHHKLETAWVSVKDINLSNLIGKFIILWDDIHGFRAMKVHSVFDKPPSDATHYFVPEPPKETDTLTAEEARRLYAKIRERQIPQNSKGTNEKQNR